jgi:hypothetical protein
MKNVSYQAYIIIKVNLILMNQKTKFIIHQFLWSIIIHLKPMKQGDFVQPCKGDYVHPWRGFCPRMQRGFCSKGILSVHPEIDMTVNTPTITYSLFKDSCH